MAASRSIHRHRDCWQCPACSPSRASGPSHTPAPAAPLGAAGNRTLLVPSGDNNLYAVDLYTAATRWVVPFAST